MTNEEKLQKLKDFLDENNLEYHDNSKKKINNLHILKYHINVHISDKYDEVFFQRMKGFSQFSSGMMSRLILSSRKFRAPLSMF